MAIEDKYTTGLAAFATTPGLKTQNGAGFVGHQEQQIGQISTNLSLAESGPYIDNSSRSLLKGLLLVLTNQVSFFLRMEAQRQDIPISNITIYGHFSPTDASQKLILTQYVNLTPKEAMSYRRRLYKALAVWVKTLPASQMTMIQDSIVVDIRWTSNATTPVQSLA